MKPKHYLLLFIASVVYAPFAHAQLIKPFAGVGPGAGYSGDNGPAIDAALNSCTSVAVDGAGNVYIADKGNNVIRKVNTAGIITTFAGNDTAGYSGNGAAATAARLNQPDGVATDAAGNVYIADYGNNVIRVVSSTTGFINTYAGNDTADYRGDGGLANHASLNRPAGIAVDGAGNLYIADYGNNVIRKVSSGGIITTIAGNGAPGSTGDNGLAINATLNSPSGVAVDASGNVFIADMFNNVVREVLDSNGVIVTFAGDYTAGSAGDGGLATSAQLFLPTSVSLDNAGSLYIADVGNNTIRRVDSSGKISIFAGNRTAGYTGNNGLPTNAELSGPIGVTADGWQRIYIADNNNNVIRLVTVGGAGISSVNASAQGVKIYPNPATGMITVEIPGAINNPVITVIDVLGNMVLSTSTTAQNTGINLTNIPSGSYFIRVVNGDKTYTNKIEIVR